MKIDYHNYNTLKKEYKDFLEAFYVEYKKYNKTSLKKQDMKLLRDIMLIFVIDVKWDMCFCNSQQITQFSKVFFNVINRIKEDENKQTK